MTQQFLDGLDTKLSRVQIAEALTTCGYVTSASTLATMATRGGGPPFCKWGPRAVYRWGDALEWAQNRMSKPRRSSSEADAQQAHAA